MHSPPHPRVIQRGQVAALLSGVRGWVPQATADGITGHAFYVQLMQAQSGVPLAPATPNAAGNQVTAAQLAAARADLRHLGIGWALVWTRHPYSQALVEAAALRLRLQDERH